jgi:threonine dehydrogenase-like Zn-dependent dehydrogenase
MKMSNNKKTVSFPKVKEGEQSSVGVRPSVSNVPTIPAKIQRDLNGRKNGLKEVQINFYPSGIFDMSYHVGDVILNASEYANIVERNHRAAEAAEEHAKLNAIIKKMRARLMLRIDDIDEKDIGTVLDAVKTPVMTVAGGVMNMSQLKFNALSHDDLVIKLRGDQAKIAEIVELINKTGKTKIDFGGWNPKTKEEKEHERAAKLLNSGNAPQTPAAEKTNQGMTPLHKKVIELVSQGKIDLDKLNSIVGDDKEIERLVQFAESSDNVKV